MGDTQPSFTWKKMALACLACLGLVGLIAALYYQFQK